jgi:hypothetical protein
MAAEPMLPQPPEPAGAAARTVAPAERKMGPVPFAVRKIGPIWSAARKVGPVPFEVRKIGPIWSAGRKMGFQRISSSAIPPG